LKLTAACQGESEEDHFDEAGRKAQARGLTPEMLESLLKGA
jgi:hypothetical protein